MYIRVFGETFRRVWNYQSRNHRHRTRHFLRRDQRPSAGTRWGKQPPAPKKLETQRPPQTWTCLRCLKKAQKGMVVMVQIDLKQRQTSLLCCLLLCCSYFLLRFRGIEPFNVCAATLTCVWFLGLTGMCERPLAHRLCVGQCVLCIV